jgi:hypothetical protein
VLNQEQPRSALQTCTEVNSTFLIHSMSQYIIPDTHCKHMSRQERPSSMMINEPVATENVVVHQEINTYAWYHRCLAPRVTYAGLSWVPDDIVLKRVVPWSQLDGADNRPSIGVQNCKAYSCNAEAGWLAKQKFGWSKLPAGARCVNRRSSLSSTLQHRPVA